MHKENGHEASDREMLKESSMTLYKRPYERKVPNRVPWITKQEKGMTQAYPESTDDMMMDDDYCHTVLLGSTGCSGACLLVGSDHWVSCCKERGTGTL